jgi:hypothetical protein
MNNKVIENTCEIGDKCILEVDGKYFGYDNDPAYPETLYRTIEDAYIFNSQSDALGITTWLSGRCFKLIRV